MATLHQQQQHLLQSFSLLAVILLLLLHPSPSHSATCTTPPLKPTTLYTTCLSLPALSTALHFTYTPANRTLSVAFTAAPPSPSGWVAWGINPIAAGMVGTQAFLAFRQPNGAVIVKTYNISSYSEVVEGKLAFEVYDKRAEANSDGSITIYAAVDSAGGKVNHVWQVGPGVTNGFPMKHEFKPENLQARGTIDLTNNTAGGSSETPPSGTGKSSLYIHGTLNAISWGILFPVGVMIARYLRTFESADPAWFYLHATCQISAYAIGVAGWATGMQLGSESKVVVYEGHRNIGIALFCLATVQITAPFLRPNKDHKYRKHWNIYHHSMGYAIVVLGIINVFQGLDILRPNYKWTSSYITILVALGGLALILEAFTWVVVLMKKSSHSAKSGPMPDQTH